MRVDLTVWGERLKGLESRMSWGCRFCNGHLWKDKARFMRRTQLGCETGGSGSLQLSVACMPRDYVREPNRTVRLRRAIAGDRVSKTSRGARSRGQPFRSYPCLGIHPSPVSCESTAGVCSTSSDRHHKADVDVVNVGNRVTMALRGSAADERI